MTPEKEIARLQALVAEKDEALSKEKKRAKKLAEKVKVLEHQLGLLKKQLFGRSSEKLDPRQLKLEFDSAYAEAAAADPPLASHGDSLPRVVDRQDLKKAFGFRPGPE